jgi:hypothetical protein
MDVHDVGTLATPLKRAQHRDDGGDAAAGSHEQQLGRRRIRQGEIALGGCKPDNGAGLDAIDQMCRQEAFGSRLDGDRDQFLVAPWDRRERVGPPMPAPTNSQPDAEVLAGLVVAGKAPSGFDRYRGRVFGFPANIDDEPTQFPRGPQRIEQFKVVIGQQRRRRASHQPSQHINRRGRRGLDISCRRRTPQPQIPHLRTPTSITVKA